jgi:hypothetical protein
MIRVSGATGPHERPDDDQKLEEATSVFVPSPETQARSSHRWRWVVLSVLFALAVAAVGVMVAWPHLNPRRSDPAERVAEAYLQALARDDVAAARRLATVDEPPAIRSVRDLRRDRARDRVLKGSFAPLADLHARIDAEYAYDPGSGRFTPKNPLGAAAQTLDALHAAKEEAEKSNLADKIKSGSPDDLFDAAEQLAKSLASLSTGALAPARILPSYKMLVESAKPPLPEDTKALALEVGGSAQSWEGLLKRPFPTLKADGPFIYERAEVNATVGDRLASLGDPPSRLRLSLVRFQLEGIDTGWKVVSARRVRPGEAPGDLDANPKSSAAVSKSESPPRTHGSRPSQEADEPR